MVDSSKEKVSHPASEQEWQEGAGGLVLLAAAHDTGLLSQLQATLADQEQSSDISQGELPSLTKLKLSLWLTLLFLPAGGQHLQS